MTDTVMTITESEEKKCLFVYSFLSSQSKKSSRGGSRNGEWPWLLKAIVSMSEVKCGEPEKKPFMSSCARVSALVLSVSNHSDPRVAWLGQGAGIQ